MLTYTGPLNSGPRASALRRVMGGGHSSPEGEGGPSGISCSHCPHCAITITIECTCCPTAPGRWTVRGCVSLSPLPLPSLSLSLPLPSFSESPGCPCAAVSVRTARRSECRHGFPGAAGKLLGIPSQQQCTVHSATWTGVLGVCKRMRSGARGMHVYAVMQAARTADVTPRVLGVWPRGRVVVLP